MWAKRSTCGIYFLMIKSWGMPVLKRTANVSMVHLAGLAGLESGIKQNFGIAGDQYHDTVVYHALIQAGVHSIRQIDGFQSGLPELIGNERLTNCNGKEYYDLLQSIRDILEKHSINMEEAGDKNKFTSLILFLTDLVYALKTDSAMIAVLPLPKIEDYYGIISPHLLSAIGNLLPNVAPIEAITPIPQLSLEASKVQVFEELLGSQLFSAYSNAHCRLENSRESDVAIINDVSLRAKSVWQRFSNTVDLKRLALTLIPITKNVADKVLTGLPGTLTGLLADILTKAAQQEKRIVIYDYGRSHKDLLVAHYEKMSRAGNQIGQ